MTREDKLVERITYLTKIALGEELNKDFSEAILQAAIKAAKVGYSFAVDEAAEWLDQNAYHYCDDIDTLHESALIGDFRHVMKGE